MIEKWRYHFMSERKGKCVFFLGVTKYSNAHSNVCVPKRAPQCHVVFTPLLYLSTNKNNIVLDWGHQFAQKSRMRISPSTKLKTSFNSNFIPEKSFLKHLSYFLTYFILKALTRRLWHCVSGGKHQSWWGTDTFVDRLKRKFAERRNDAWKKRFIPSVRAAH